MSNQLTTQTQQAELVPLVEITQAANLIAKSGLFGVKTLEQAASLMLVAQSEGLHYARAVLEYDIINGKPALKSNAVLSRFQKSGGTIKYVQATDTLCEVEATHAAAGKITIKWTLEMATKADLTQKATWQNYPAAMLRARAVREAITALYPACLSGFYCSEEVQDFGDLNDLNQKNISPHYQRKPKFYRKTKKKHCLN